MKVSFVVRGEKISSTRLDLSFFGVNIFTSENEI
jgi:hypothetical protein